MIQTGVGGVGIKALRVRDRAGKIRFTSAILPLEGATASVWGDPRAALLGA